MKIFKITNTKKFFGIALISVMGLTGCSKFLDINDNPNNPEKADPSLLLPTIEAGISQVVGNAFQVYGGFWAQYWTQNPSASQYRSLDRYQILNTATDRAWSILYRSTLINAELIINSDAAGAEQLKGIAHLLKAYSFQVATDAFGDVPGSESLKGEDFINPNYDKQEAIYDIILASIKSGKELIAKGEGSSAGSQDMIFAGDLEKWAAFANTLELKVYLRLSEINASKAQAGIKALYATNPTFLTEDASITYSTTGGNENPLYNEMVGLGRTQNIVASSTAVTQFVKNKDTRRFAFYNKLSGEDTIAHIIQGGSETIKKSVSSPSSTVGGSAIDQNSALAPVKLIGKSEAFFLQAEAVARNWASGDAAALYNEGVKASFSELGLTADYAAYAGQESMKYPAAGTTEDKVKAIITQKYFAMCGFQGFEAWSEWRRTGYPDFLIESVGNRLGKGKMPMRLPYPNSEITTNGNFPGAISIDNKVWWDTK